MLPWRSIVASDFDAMVVNTVIIVLPSHRNNDMGARDQLLSANAGSGIWHRESIMTDYVC